MKLTLTAADGITPDLIKRTKQLAQRTGILRSMGMAVVSLTKRAWTDPSVRPAPWPARKRETGKLLLVASSLLRRSPRIVSVSTDAVEVGTDRPYAQYHQFGTKHIPQRPFFPFSGPPEAAVPTAQADKAIKAAARRVVDAALES